MALTGPRRGKRGGVASQEKASGQLSVFPTVPIPSPLNEAAPFPFRPGQGCRTAVFETAQGPHVPASGFDAAGPLSRLFTETSFFSSHLINNAPPQDRPPQSWVEAGFV